MSSSLRGTGYQKPSVADWGSICLLIADRESNCLLVKAIDSRIMLTASSLAHANQPPLPFLVTSLLHYNRRYLVYRTSSLPFLSVNV